MGYSVVMVDPAETVDFSTFDVAFIALHGFFGEDGCVQALLESSGKPYTGSGVTASVLGMNKLASKLVFEQKGIPTAGFRFFLEPLSELPSGFEYPVVVKPVSEGSSVGVSIADDAVQLAKDSAFLCKQYGGFLLEEFITGVELTIGVIEDPMPIALPILELRPHNRFYDFDAKYTKGKTDFILPAEISETATVLCQELAVRTYEAFGCKGMSRVDMILSPERGPFVLEVNTLPGMTDTSDLPAQAKEAGYSFDQLVELILKQAVKE
jgi:D-alanine-D-alanine ligase